MCPLFIKAGYECPYCNSNKVYKSHNYLFFCEDCRKKFHEYQVDNQRFDESKEDYSDE